MHLFRSRKKPQGLSERITEKKTFLENILLPCVLFSTLTGIFTGALVFSFNVVSTYVIHQSSELYHWVRENPAYTPLLIAGVLLLGLFSGWMLKLVPSARGGSLPVAVAHLRGHIAFRWIPNIVFVYLSSMITYLVGVPLGNEAPCVQMGAAAGKGTVSLFAKKTPRMGSICYDRRCLRGICRDYRRTALWHFLCTGRSTPPIHTHDHSGRHHEYCIRRSDFQIPLRFIQRRVDNYHNRLRAHTSSA